MDINLNPRYQNRPVILFFEKYVLHTLGLLPDDKSQLIESLNLAKVFATKAQAWPLVIEEMLQLSDTINITIMNEWLNYLASCSGEPSEQDQNDFAIRFVDRYFEDGSTLDRWTESGLAAAKKRIEEHFHAAAE